MELVLDVVRGMFMQLQNNAKGHITMGVFLGSILLFATMVSLVPVIALVFVLNGVSEDKVLPMLGGLMAVTFIGMLFAIIPYMLFFFGYIRAAVREAEGGAPVSLGQVWQDVQAVGGRVFVSNLMAGGIEFVGLLCCYVPGLVASIVLWHANSLVVAGGRRPADAIREAARTMWANPGKHLTLYAGFFFCALVSSWLPLIGMFVTPIVTAVYMARALRATYPDVGGQHLLEMDA